MRAIDADAITYESIDSSDTGRHEHYYGTGIIAVRKEDIDAMPTIQPEPHWIPVTERLPNKEEKSYWVCLEGGGQCQCRWTNNVYGLGANEWSKWGWKKMDLPQYSKVVAYMPLPEPYKGVTDGND